MAEPRPTETGGPLASPGWHLWQAALRWKNAVRTALAPHGLTPTQFFVLGAAGWMERTAGAPRQKDVAALAGLDLMTTSQVVRALDKAGLLARHDDPDDARSWRLSPTPAGRAVLKKAAAAVRAADAAFFAKIPARFVDAVDGLGEEPSMARS